MSSVDEEIREHVNRYISTQVEERIQTWLEKAHGVDFTQELIRLRTEVIELKEERDKLREEADTWKRIAGSKNLQAIEESRRASSVLMNQDQLQRERDEARRKIFNLQKAVTDILNSDYEEREEWRDE